MRTFRDDAVFTKQIQRFSGGLRMSAAGVGHDRKQDDGGTTNGRIEETDADGFVVQTDMEAALCF